MAAQRGQLAGVNQNVTCGRTRSIVHPRQDANLEYHRTSTVVDMVSAMSACGTTSVSVFEVAVVMNLSPSVADVAPTCCLNAITAEKCHNSHWSVKMATI